MCSETRYSINKIRDKYVLVTFTDMRISYIYIYSDQKRSPTPIPSNSHLYINKSVMEYWLLFDDNDGDSNVRFSLSSDGIPIVLTKANKLTLFEMI